MLWLQDLIEVNRIGELRPMDQKQFEITFQLLLGPGYREYQRYVVGASHIEDVDPKARRALRSLDGYPLQRFTLRCHTRAAPALSRDTFFTIRSWPSLSCFAA